MLKGVGGEKTLKDGPSGLLQALAGQWKMREGNVGENSNASFYLRSLCSFASLSRQGLGTRKEGLYTRDREFPFPDSRTSGLHVCSRDVSIY